jgi:hypothetical protein
MNVKITDRKGEVLMERNVDQFWIPNINFIVMSHISNNIEKKVYIPTNLIGLIETEESAGF